MNDKVKLGKQRKVNFLLLKSIQNSTLYTEKQKVKYIRGFCIFTVESGSGCCLWTTCVQICSIRSCKGKQQTTLAQWLGEYHHYGSLSIIPKLCVHRTHAYNPSSKGDEAGGLPRLYSLSWLQS